VPTEMPTDEQIRELCARVIGAADSEFDGAIRDLQSAIRHRLEDLSNQAVATLLRMPRVLETRRRTTNVRSMSASDEVDETDPAA
jgi:hypothetical protein